MNFKSACFLLNVCHAGSAIALGLGDVSVRSHLGQPLHAVVPLMGASPETTADCLSLANSPDGIAPLPPARLSLEQVAGQSLLHIRTDRSVSDPVLQFVLIADCEVRLQREYAVLLDPPVQVETAGGSDTPSAETTTVAVAEPEAVSAPAPTRRRPASLKRTVPVSADAPAIKSRLPAPKPRPAAQAPAPRLVLSGKRDGAGSPLAPGLDTTLSEPEQPRSETLSPTDLSDENTALNRKIAYLEAQLAALQKRNAELDREAREAVPVAVAAPPVVKQAPQWPLYLLVAGLLAGAPALVAGLRRRSRNRSHSVSIIDDAWVQPDTPPMGQTAGVDAVSMAPVPQRMEEVSAPPSDVGTEIKEDILDQAEVFMAHGHGELAIHLLQEHLREAPTESPVPWLLLLDLLHRAGDTTGYVAASTECRRHFNVNLDGRAFFDDDGKGLGLEAYPHLLEQLVQVWGTAGVRAFFEDLLYDQRGGTRIGFEPGAYRDILLLRSIAHDIASGQKPEKQA